MDKIETEKAKLGFKTVEDFFLQFGSDVHTRILLEEILEGVMNAESLFIFGEQKQTGDQISNSPSDREQHTSQLQNNGFDNPQSSNSLSEKDREDYV